MKKKNKMRWNEEFNHRKGIMKEEFSIKMTKDEMLRFYANKIVEDGIRSCSEFNTIVSLTDYNTHNIKLENYKNEILELLYKDERVADVIIDDELNVDMVFYTDYCPFYYEDEESMLYNDIEDNPIFQAKVLEEFVDYIKSRVFQDAYINVRVLINDFVDSKQETNDFKDKLSNFLKSNIIKSGFTDKYIENIDVYITPRNHKELEVELFEIAKQLESENEETEEFE